MKRIIIFSLVAISFIAAAFFWLSSRARQAIDTSNVAESFVLSAHVPPLNTVGSMYLMYEGHIDGEAEFVITSNQGRDHKSIKLNSGSISGIYGGAEEWVDDIDVSYVPKLVKSGKIYAVVYCGKGMTAEDWKMYGRLSRNPSTQTEQDAAANP